ncbi:sensor domain-containing protein [Planctomonas psychrotolerans]|uniref:sensor domain-containing protein n=1 Tax=Planctomonas psychrotolerans TaxID=2528712 RepID=UPI001D0D44AB|nr:EAL domain-containing protein [Planctomonas psychrotolerans]
MSNRSAEGRDADAVSVVIQALGTMADGSIITDAQQRIVYVSPAFTLMTGYDIDEIRGRNCRFLQGPDSDEATTTAIRRAMGREDAYQGVILNYRKNGEAFWNALTIMPLRDRRGKVTHYASVQRDVTALIAQEKQTQHLLEETKRQRETDHLLLEAARLLGERSSVSAVAQTVADVTPGLCGADKAAVALWDAKDERLFIAAVSGWDGALGDRIRTFEATPEQSPELYEIMQSQAPAIVDGRGSDWAKDVMARYETRAIVIVPIASAGALRGLLLAAWSDSEPPDSIDSTLRDRMAGLAGLAAVAIDNTRLLEEVRWTESHDGLTGLPNRALLEERVAGALERSRTDGTDVAVLFYNIDRLKRVNDVLGHGSGDAVLCHVAATLRSAAREGDIVARSGGNDFVIVLPGIASPAEADEVAERVISLLEQPLVIAGRDVFVHLSHGVAMSVDRSAPMARVVPLREEAEQLITAANNSMHEARSRKMSDAEPFGGIDELRLDSELHGALQRGELTVWYQPQVDVRSDRIVAVEALVRWHHPILGAIPPSAFIPIAEENGLIHEMGRFVLNEACTLAALWQDRGHRLEVAVNVSALQLTSPEFFTALTSGLRDCALDPAALTIEITESQMVGDIATVAPRLAALRNLGVGISVDDFGTGYSSLSQLHTLPVTELKIDQTFIRNDSATSAALVAAVVGLSRGLSLRVVAEGVETPEQLQMLRDLNCDRAQGYLIARPMPRSDLDGRLGMLSAV